MKEIMVNSNLDNQLAEMLILKELVHPNIVKYKDRPLDLKLPDEYAKVTLIFMEYCERGSLRKCGLSELLCATCLPDL